MGLPSYVVNFDELVKALKNYLQNGVNVDIGNLTFSTDDIERLLEDITDKMQGVDYNDLINALNNLGIKLDGLAGNLGISGTQRIYGKMLKIPSVKGQHTIEFRVPSVSKITGITYSQSAWRCDDSWDLIVGEEKLFDKVRTKEYGEHKYFNVFYQVNSGQVIKFIFNNNSGSSKTLWVDFNLLEDREFSTINRTLDFNSEGRDYRILSVGESEYSLQGAKNLKGCVYDAQSISNLFKQHKQINKFKKNVVAKNKTKIEILNLIKTTFQDSVDEDINYLFWSGHGTVFNDKFALVSKDDIITIDELKIILDRVKGTKIIFIDTCHSGLIINKDFAYELAVFEESLRNKRLNINSINKVVNKKVFKLIEKGIEMFSKELDEPTYKVLTACSGSEASKDLPVDFCGNTVPSGAFTWALTQSIKNKVADKDNNKIVTLQEMYESILHFYDEFNKLHPSVMITQKAQVYPINDIISVFEYSEK